MPKNNNNNSKTPARRNNAAANTAAAKEAHSHADADAAHAAHRHAFNKKVLRRHDANIDDIIESASFVVLYEHHDGEWTKTGIEGPMFLYRRTLAPFYGFFIMNRNGVENFSGGLSQDDDLDVSSQFIIYRPDTPDDEEDGVFGIWVFEASQRDNVGQQMLRLQQTSTSKTSEALPVASAAGMVATAPEPPSVAASTAAPVTLSAGQSISLDALFAGSSPQVSHAAAAAPAPSQAPPTPSQASASAGAALLDSMFRSAAAQAPAPSSLPPPSLTPGQGAPHDSRQQPDSGADGAAGLMKLLGLSKPATGPGPVATPPSQPPLPPPPQLQSQGPSNALDLLFSRAGSSNGRVPTAPSAPRCAGHLVAAPRRSANPTYDVRMLPRFDELPHVPGQPKGCAWGLFDTVGPNGEREKDQLGTLNLLTPANTVRAAQSEIRTGERVQLDWTLDKPCPPVVPGRQKLRHQIRQAFADPPVNDDEFFYLNTQGSSQWDGLRHVAHRASRLGYNGVAHDAVASGREPLQNGIHAWCDAGGIAGRGVLLDWLSWWRAHHGRRVSPGGGADGAASTMRTPPHPCTPHAIPLSELLACAAWQGTALQPADVLLVRTGFVEWYEACPDESSRQAWLAASPPSSSSAAAAPGSRDGPGRPGRGFLGVEASEEVKRWLWDSHFAAVGGDAVAWEVLRKDEAPEVWLHEWLLAMWGMPVGELMDLEALSETCARLRRWSFFVTSAPLRVPGGVASPPNMIAIF